MNLRRLLIRVVVVCVGATPVFGQTGRFVEVSGDFSPVQIGAANITWQVAHLAAGVQQDGQFGWMATADRHQRGSLADVSFGASGFRRMGAWTIFGSGAFVDSPHFLYRRSLEGEVSRILLGTLVGHAGYRHLEFSGSTVRVLQPGLSYYFARGSLETRGFFVRNMTARTDNVSVLVRGTVAATSRISLMTGFARGARIFDVSTLPLTTADAWVAFGSVRFAMTPQWNIELGAGGAHEDPFFSQRTLSLRVRRIF